MAKKKASNPVDAARKAARARELKRNKAEREKVREVVTVRKDTKGLEADIRRLESKEKSGTLTKSDKSDLADLKAELARILEAKEAYVAAHPEHKKYVYGKESQPGGSETVFGDGKKKIISNTSSQASDATRGNAGQSAMGMGPYQRDPKRSVYYHEIFNPLGAPPPGMPYLEKPPDQWDPPFGIPTYTGPPPSLNPPIPSEGSSSRQGPVEESDSKDPSQDKKTAGDEEQGSDDDGEEEEEGDEDEDEDEDEIALPAGPAPALPELPVLPEEDSAEISKARKAEDSDSDSDIVMPEGPPPPVPQEEEQDAQPPLPPIPTGPKSNVPVAPPLPSGPPPPSQSSFNLPPPGFYSGPPPPLPNSFPPPPLPNSFPPPPLPNSFPPPPLPHSFPPPPLPSHPSNFQHPPPGYGPPRVGFNHRGSFDRGRGRGGRGGRGRGHYPTDQRDLQQQEIFDPLSADGKSHQTFAAHASRQREKSRSENDPEGSNSSNPSSTGLNSLPSKPSSSSDNDVRKPMPSATISAEPQLRDLKKEVTAFLPPAMRKKLQKEKERKEMGLPNVEKLTSAPREEESSGSSGHLEGWDDGKANSNGNKHSGNADSPNEASEYSKVEKPNLLNALKTSLNGPAALGSRVSLPSGSGGNSSKETGKKRKNDDYDKFLNEMGDLL